MSQSESIGKLAEALAKAQSVMKPAPKDQNNPFFKSKYADLAGIWDAIREPLSKNGLAVVQTTDYSMVTPGVIVTTTLMHTSGEWISGNLMLNPVKPDPQGIGAAITYGRRFGLAAITGMCSDDEDDDGNAASGKVIQQRPAPANHVQAPVAFAPQARPTVTEQIPAVVEQKPAETLKCGMCQKPITDGVDAKGKPYTADKIADISQKTYRKPMCYECFKATKELAANMEEAFGTKAKLEVL